MSEVARDKKIGEIAYSLTDAPEAKWRLEAADTLHDLGLRSRTSLENRGMLRSSASSPFSDKEEVMEALEEGLKSAISDPDPDVRLLAVQTAAHIGDDTLVEALKSRLQDDRHDINLAAIYALGEIGGLDSLQALADVIAEDVVVESETETYEMRFAALTALEGLAEKEISSGADHQFSPAETKPETEASAEMDPLSQVKEILVEPLEEIASDRRAGILWVKACDILANLGSGMA